METACSLPETQTAHGDIIISVGIGSKAVDRGMKAGTVLSLHLSQHIRLEMMSGSPVMYIAQLHIGKPDMTLARTAINLSRALDIGGIETAVVVRIITVAAIDRRRQSVADIPRDTQMGIEMHGFVMFLDIQQRERIINLAGIGISVVSAGSIADGRESGVESRSGIKHLLHIIEIPVMPDGTEEPEVKGEVSVERMLCHIQLGGQVARAHLPDDTVVLAEGYGTAVVGILRTASERQMMVLHKARAHDRPLPVRVSPSVHDRQSSVRSHRPVSVRRHHIQETVGVRKAHISGIGDMKLTSRPPACAHLNDPGSPSGTVLGSLSGIFEDSETLYITGKNRSKRPQVGGHAVNDDQRFVTSRQGVVSANAYRRKHGFGVHVRAHRDPGGLTTEDIQRIGQVSPPGSLHPKRVRIFGESGDGGMHTCYQTEAQQQGQGTFHGIKFQNRVQRYKK